MSETGSVRDEMSTITPATSLAETSASPSASPTPSQDGKSDGRFKADDALTADQLDSLYDNLPDDSTALKAIVGTMRLEMSKRDYTISTLRNEIDEVKASHSVILQRSAEWKDELETLRLKVPNLEAELKREKQARESEADRVKDLRLRAEESRRAIMRLQGDQGAARAKAKAENRRSMGPGSLSSWVPPGSSGGRDEQEEAELKKSKRASLAFGPNAGLNILATGGRPGHRRTASGSRSVSGNSRTGDADDFDEPLSPTLSGANGGLRGLRLSNASLGIGGSSLLHPGNNGDGGNSDAGSRRSSYQSNANRSPRLSAADLPATELEGWSSATQAANRLSVPSGTGGIRTLLGMTSPALSQTAASSNGCASPILEDGEDADGNSQTDRAATADSGLTALPPSGLSELGLVADLKAKDIEVERLTREMREMRTRMEEAIEARLASEACMKALRDFISTHDAAADADASVDEQNASVGNSRSSIGAGLLKGVKLPPLPTDDIIDDDADEVSAKRDASKGVSGWSMKLPQLIRKNTVSSNGNTSSLGPTPSDEAGPSAPTSGPSSQKNAATATSSSSSIGGSLANLLSRNSISLSSSPFASGGAAAAGNLDQRGGQSIDNSSATRIENPATEAPGSPPITANAFKGFGWFKKGSPASVSPGVPGQDGKEGPARPPPEFEDKVMSPPFRSLDHDQVAITRQSVLLNPEAVNARFAEEVGGAATPKRPAEPEVSARAQKALQKTANVEVGGDFKPADFD